MSNLTEIEIRALHEARLFSSIREAAGRHMGGRSRS